MPEFFTMTTQPAPRNHGFRRRDVLSHRALCFSLLALVLLCANLADCGELRVVPDTIELYGSGAFSNWLSSVMTADAAVADRLRRPLGRPATPRWFESNGDGVSRRDGVATLTATTHGGIATASVRVAAYEEESPGSFDGTYSRSSREPVVIKERVTGRWREKVGFACHCADISPQEITRRSLAKREVGELSCPTRGVACCLAKPSGALPHKGGLRFDPQSREYQVLAEWITIGRRGPDGRRSEVVADSRSSRARFG